MYTPIKKSATARLVKRNELTLLASFAMDRHIITVRFPTKAMMPRIQMEYFRTVFFKSSSQLEKPLSALEIHVTLGLLCFA
jgi:hypothetical protein